MNAKTCILNYWPAQCAGVTTFGILVPLLSLGVPYVSGCLIVAFTAGYIAQRLWDHYGSITNHGMVGICMFALFGYGKLLNNIIKSELESALISAILLGGMLLLASIMWLMKNWDVINWRRFNLKKKLTGRINKWQFWPAIAGAIMVAPTVYQFITISWVIGIPVALLTMAIAGYIAQAISTIYGKAYFSIILVLLLAINQYGHLINDLINPKSEQALTTALFMGLYLLFLPGAWLEAIVRKQKEDRQLSPQNSI